jgi:hypothetical protein
MSIAGRIGIATAGVGGETAFVVAAGIAIGAVEHLYDDCDKIKRRLCLGAVATLFATECRRRL